jgi:hypothetical protein
MLPLLVCAAILQNGIVRDPSKDSIRVEYPCQVSDDLSIRYEKQRRNHLPSRVIDPNANRLRWLE